MMLVAISIGTIQFGYSIGSWNTVTDAYAIHNNWTDEEKTHKQSVVQSVNIAGSAIGAFFSGPIMKIGRWNCILLTNIFVIGGCVLTMVENYPCLIIGRFLYGYAAGAYSLFCPKFISETAPTEVKGPAGALSQVCVTFGILVPFAIGLAYPPPTELSPSDLKWFIVLIFAIPIGLAVL